MTTIRDVAKLAGVSITTASYVLNNTGNISEATRLRVLEAAGQLNYYPNAHARHLKKAKTLILGVFISRFGGSFYEEILEGIHSVILETDYELIVSPETSSPRRLLHYRQVDGAIVFDSKIKDDSVIKLASRRFPIVVMDRFLTGDYIFPSLLDNAQGVRQAFQHFYQQGFRRLAYVAGSPDSFDNQERTRTFLQEAEQAGVQVRVVQGYFNEISGYQAAQTLFQSSPLPEAVFCANDQMAIGFLRAMRERGLRAPDDIALAGFDDIPIARYMQPSLSTVGASRLEWGADATRQLLNFLENDTPFQPRRIPTHFIARESSTARRG